MTVLINGTVLDEDAIAREIQYHPAKDLDTARSEAAKALVIRTLLVQQARREGLHQEDEDDAVEALLELHVAVDEPDEARCRTWHEQVRDRYRAPDLFEASHILLPAMPDDQDQRQEAKVTAEECLAILQDKPDRFASLATEFSACASAQNGGSLGQISNGDTVDEFETFLYNLEPGQLCPVPVQTRFGYHVLRLDHRELGRELPYDAAKEAVRDDLLSQDWRVAGSAYVKQLVAEAEISGINI